MGVGVQRHAPAVLPPGNTRYPLHRRLGGLQDRSGRLRIISPTKEFDLRIFQPLASHYNVYAERFNVDIPLFGARYFVRWVS